LIAYVASIPISSKAFQIAVTTESTLTDIQPQHLHLPTKTQKSTHYYTTSRLTLCFSISSLSAVTILCPFTSKHFK
jgi:hypothetical protein